MRETRFWKLIGLLDGEVDGPGLDDLTTAAEGLSERGQDDFAEHLHGRIRQLSTPPLREHLEEWLRAHEHVSDDMVLFLASAVIAAGQHTFEAVVTDPTRLNSRDWELGGADLLWGVIPEPAEENDLPRPSDVDWLHILAEALGDDLYLVERRSRLAGLVVAPRRKWLRWRAEHGVNHFALCMKFSDRPEPGIVIERHPPNVSVIVELPLSRYPPVPDAVESWVALVEEAMTEATPMVRRCSEKGGARP